MRTLGTGLISISVLLAGCSGMGSQPVLTRTGVVDADVRNRVLTSGAVYNFVQAERVARPYLSPEDTHSSVWVSRREEDPAAVREMLNTGFAAIFSSCDDFFQSSGRDQTRLLVLRDIIVAMTSLAGGAVSVLDDNDGMGGEGNERVLAAIGLGSTTALTGIDIYTQRFLFGAENIDAVRELTLRALETHRSGVLFPQAPATPPTTYDRVLVHLRDNQAKCSPRAITRLARDAIAGGHLAPDTREGSRLAEIIQTNDQQVLAELARILDVQTVTGRQIGALWWLLMTSDNRNLAPTSAEVDASIKPALAGLARGPFDANGAPQTPWSAEAAVRSVLGRLGETTLQAFRAQIAEARQPTGGGGIKIDSAGALAPVPFRLSEPARTSSDSRVSVRVVPPG